MATMNMKPYNLSLRKTSSLSTSTIFLLIILFVATSRTTTTSALSTSSSNNNANNTRRNKFTKIPPLKAAMLTKNWQGLLMDVDQKVGIVPELGSTSVGVKRFGPELERRTKCARQFERMFEGAFALATADKTDDPSRKRLGISSLLIDGAARGVGCATFACLTSPATISLVEQQHQEGEWNVLALTVNPEERDINLIVDAERAMLAELHHALRDVASNDDDGGDNSPGVSSSLRVHCKVMETLAGNCEQLGLTPIALIQSNDDNNDDDSNLTEEEPIWFRCDL